ncbi:MAG: TraB/GumN family protein [Novosphingobium sp.]|nr:TraB/GumN family protein [Novosphingobium sp.]
MKILARIAAALSLLWMPLTASPALADGMAKSATQAAADQPVPAPVLTIVPPSPAITSVARPALWKVADEDTTIYLFGTVHVLPSGIDWLNGKVAAAFDDSRELVTEILPLDPALMQQLVIAKALLPKGQTLRGMLKPQDRAELEAALANMGLPPGTFDPFEPWYAAIGMTTLPLTKAGFDGKNGVEHALEARAKTSGMAHLALETVEQQLSVFDGLPMAVQERYLDAIVEQIPQIHAKVNALVEAWKTGDAETLAALMNEDEKDPVMLQRLLIDRNKAWAAWIDERLGQPGTVFVAVGAGHLAGPGSVQDQLAARRITARRVQ